MFDYWDGEVIPRRNAFKNFFIEMVKRVIKMSGEMENILTILTCRIKNYNIKNL
jgi:hypothetical protein